MILFSKMPNKFETKCKYPACHVHIYLLVLEKAKKDIPNKKKIGSNTV